MKNITRFVTIFTAALAISACSSGGSPGPLEGTWQMSGPVPMAITFRNGETEAMGMIEKVSYKVEGQDVLVTYLDGMAKGTTIRYTVINSGSARTALGSLRRVQ